MIRSLPVEFPNKKTIILHYGPDTNLFFLIRDLTPAVIDWNYDEDRSQIRTGFGPENITRLRRFAIGLLKDKKSNETIPEMMKKLMLNARAVFDYLKTTRNSNPSSIG